MNGDLTTWLECANEPKIGRLEREPKASAPGLGCFGLLGLRHPLPLPFPKHCSILNIGTLNYNFHPWEPVVLRRVRQLCGNEAADSRPLETLADDHRPQAARLE